MATLGRTAQLSEPIFSRWPTHDITNHAMGTGSIQSARRPMDFNEQSTKSSLISFQILYCS